MIKHAFIVRWHRTGRTVTPILDAHIKCQWPLGPEANDNASARALLQMLGGLPKEVKQFIDKFRAITLRVRYGSDLTGPYVLNDVNESLDSDKLDAFIQGSSDETLNQYLFGYRRKEI